MVKIFGRIGRKLTSYARRVLQYPMRSGVAASPEDTGLTTSSGSSPGVPLPARAKPGESPSRRSAGPPRTLVHLHIPKTAGTTLTSILAQTSPTQDSRLTLGDSDLPRLQAMPTSERENLRFVFGHLSHGVAALLPQPCLYVCVLREPGPRVLSLFHYIRRTADHPLHGILDERDMSFGQYLEFVSDRPNIRKEVDNGQMRRLAGRMDPSRQEREREIFDLALHNIMAPDMMYGLTEHFDDFLARLQARGIIRHYRSGRRNAAPEPANLEAALVELTPAQRRLYDQFTAWDHCFYDICKRAYFGPQATEVPVRRPSEALS